MKSRRIPARRLVTGLLLALALVMLVLGTTLLSSHLKESIFLIYWLICFLLTGLAAILALVDMVLIRHESREEQRALIKETLEQTEKDAKEFKPSDES